MKHIILALSIALALGSAYHYRTLLEHRVVVAIKTQAYDDLLVQYKICDEPLQRAKETAEALGYVPPGP